MNKFKEIYILFLGSKYIKMYYFIQTRKILSLISQIKRGGRPPLFY